MNAPVEKARWNRRYRNGHYYYLESKQFRKIYQHAAASVIESGALSVLDVGCWSGMFCSALYSAGYAGTYVGYDISTEAVEGCRSRFAHNDSCSFLVHEWGDGFLDGSFDAIYLGGVLYYVDDRKRFLREHMERYGASCIVVQDLASTDIPTGGWGDSVSCRSASFNIPMDIYGDPNLNERQVYTFTAK